MTKSVREVEVKFFLTYLDAVLNQNYTLEKIDVEDNSFPQSLECKNLTGSFRIKSLLRNGSFIELVYLKIS